MATPHGTVRTPAFMPVGTQATVKGMYPGELLGADIAMQLDECVRLPAARADIERGVRLSLAWAERSKQAFAAGDGRALFGIVQGGDDSGLRLASARGVTAIGFSGYAIGGL